MPQTMAEQMWVSIIVIGLSTFLHVFFVAAAATAFRRYGGPMAHGPKFFRDSLLLVLLVFWLLSSHLIGIVIWAGAYVHLSVLDGWEPALYFSAASYTTLGFGDVLLPDEWRLMSGANAACGFLLFGLSGAVLFEAVRRLHLGAPKE